MDKPPTKIKQDELIQVFDDLERHRQDGVCFLLGAGASFTSGIPTGGKLAKEWYAEIKKNIGDGLSAWQQKIGLDESRLAKFYPQIFEQRFKDHPTTGFGHLQERMKDAEPSIGYSFLAQILAKTQHKIVITTNFDHMVEDALRTYTDARPLVCGHESLAPYINTHTLRPTVIKVHRDLLLHPFNNIDNTNCLAEAWQLTLEPILQRYFLVVIGYGGNDGSLMKYLQAIKNRKGIYWCYRPQDGINGNISNILTQDGDRLVEIEGFDELMLALNELAFHYPLPINLKNLSKSPIVKIARERAGRYKTQFLAFAEKKAKVSPADSENDVATNEALLKLSGFDETKPTYWWQIQLKINEESDPERKQQLYEEGLKLLPDSAELMGNYALFLHNIRKDYEQAEAYYRKALDLDANNANSNGNYAGLLLAQGRLDQALPYLETALQSDQQNLLLECWFYRLAHFPEWREEAKRQIESLLQQGIRSPGWDFSETIRRAEQDGYPDVAELTALAARISEVEVR